MDVCEELTRVIQALKMVPVTGDYWMVMQACVNSITKVLESLRGEDNAVNDSTKS